MNAIRKPQVRGNRIKELLMKVIFLSAALFSTAAVLIICLFLFARGIPAINEIGWLNFLTGTRWKPSDVPPSFGILPMIVGSVYATGLAIAMGAPVGILAAIFISKFSPPKIRRFINAAVGLMAGIPSVVYGYFGMVVIVPAIGRTFRVSGASLLAAGIMLAIMILPTIIQLSVSAIDAVPATYYEGALAVGATHEQSVFRVVVPAARSGVLSAIILGVGRAIGETMAVTMVIGNQAVMPESLIRGARTMTTNIITEMGYAVDLHYDALIATGVVLFVFILIINFSFSIIKNRGIKYDGS
ncbi:MAG: phosphate ABC transporter permease subunit PstC [Clostridiaceae bacterium]|nr:phosphate ABC transporter permease subunit PstC [Clostridiaceae bacterium]